ncbi:uncharacterized protein LOC127708343 isoform X5 [Mytilus californianus]|uniref:uncharacterized protein LOC127708343 isoform X5 n=1 Tax=Mytilus californianus TaxID=6549 RepID=UPI002245749F|nr:uncharacterized protein LOC127708343 isoform X5 [Mytilus californianus]
MEYMFLRSSECLCTTDKGFNGVQTNRYVRENIDACNISCIEKHEDICGGNSSTNGKELYSVYQIINRTSTEGMQFGSTCSAIQFDELKKSTQCKYTQCSSNLKYICEGYNKSNGIYPKECNDDRVSWYTAQQNCQEKSLQLTSYLLDTKCLRNNDLFWVGNHADERIVWGENGNLPGDAVCLKIVINGSEIRLDTAKCTSQLGSLCYTLKHTSDDKGPTKPYISTISTVENNSTDKTKSDSNDDKTNIIVPIVAGGVGGILAIVIVPIIVIVIKRRIKTERENMDVGVVQRQPDTNSKPIKITIPEESRKLVNVTEEGIDNHLGDSEKMIEMKQQDSSIYDVMGDDEYYVFTASEKRQKFKEDDDLYDHGESSDVYNTLNDTVTTNRPESDTYNVK